MADYCHVTAGTVDEGPRSLPKAWRNVSGLHFLSDADLKPLGWLPEEKIGFAPFDPVTQIRTGLVTDIQAAKVVSTYTVRAKTAQEITDEAEVAAEADVGAEPIREALVDTLLDLDNRIRVLEGQGSITRDAARTTLRTRIKAHL